MGDAAAVEAAVRQTQARYTDAVWRKDLDALGDCLTADSQWRIAGRVFDGRAAVVAHMRSVFPQFRRIFMTFRIAFKALARNKLRTALTMLGMIIGVAAVIAMVALGTGALTTTGAGGSLGTSVAGTTLTNAIGLGAGSTLTVGGANNLGLGGAIVGSGNLAVNGPSTIVREVPA